MMDYREAEDAKELFGCCENMEKRIAQLEAALREVVDFMKYRCVGTGVSADGARHDLVAKYSFSGNAGDVCPQLLCGGTDDYCGNADGTHTETHTYWCRICGDDLTGPCEHFESPS